MTNLNTGTPKALNYVLMIAFAFSWASPSMAQLQGAAEVSPPPRVVVDPGRGAIVVQPYVTDDPKAKPRTVLVPGRGGSM